MTHAASPDGTNPWLADDSIILGMRADPVPEDACLNVCAECAMMRADANGPVHADALEMQRRMPRIVFQELKVFVRDRLNGGRQRLVTPPKYGGGAMD